jgi:hypothetical protein
MFVVWAWIVMMVGGWLFAGCTDGATAARARQSGNALLRERPSRRAVERAFARVQDEVTRCLTSDVAAVRIVGTFAGEDGAFTLESAQTRSGAALPFAVATCVRATIERARVRPFRAQSERVERVFSASVPDVTSHASAAASGGSSASGLSRSRVHIHSEETHGALRFAAAPEELVRREHDALQRCFEEARETVPNLEGILEIRFTLDGQGRVVQSSHRVVSERPAAGLLSQVGACIEAHVRLIAFGAQANGGGTHAVLIELSGRETFGPSQAMPGE